MMVSGHWPEYHRQSGDQVKGQFRVAHAAHGVQFGAAQLRVAFAHGQAAVGGQAGQQDVEKEAGAMPPRVLM